ncbi:MAG: D-alanine--D-alanine ligase [Bacteroidetes bacterium]|nr:MAG: D-alanine--D-alanine ligase [Bacteroidota bacterium]
MLKIGIFFGGQSREREISFAGGRTVYDNLNKDLFEPIPIFVDSIGNFIVLDWKYVYKGTIRDFYPASKFYPENENFFQIYIESLGQLSDNELNKIISEAGKKILPHEFSSTFDIAFLALHGQHGEDGSMQGLLEWYGIPYSGSGILPSAIGINKLIQKQIMRDAGFDVPQFLTLKRENWNPESTQKTYDEVVKKTGLPIVIKAPNQGSSIGVSIIQHADLEAFKLAVNKSFFIEVISKNQWKAYSETEKHSFIRDLADIRVGIGMPVQINKKTCFSPTLLLSEINLYFESNAKDLIIESTNGESYILFEEFVNGKEFSTIVIQDENGNAVSLPPTQIIKKNDVFDYRSKYLPGMSRKITPIDLPIESIKKICSDTEKLFDTLHCNVYARIDGFITESGKVFLNDPNTTSGMMPSSFFFHQAAEIGLSPSQFLTYLIRTSLKERANSGKNTLKSAELMQKLDNSLEAQKTASNQKIPVAVIMGGYSTERHISVESGRNIYEKLASSTKYAPFPVFLTGNDDAYDLYKIPVNIMLKDNADDIKEKVLHPSDIHPIILEIRQKTKSIFEKYTSGITLKSEKISLEDLAKICKKVFIALHGRPGEDGSLQQKLIKVGLPFNGSGVKSSSTTINKYETNEILMKSGFLVAKHQLVDSISWHENKEETINKIEKNLMYPLIAKPHDDGCSSAVKKIKNSEELKAFGNMMFRPQPEFLDKEAKILNLKYNEEFPQKKYFLIEELISANGASHFLEITGGMLTHKDFSYEVFEPSETLASGEILSLEEKFLAGEGQNITPARFSKNPQNQQIISEKVRETLGKVAQTLNVEGYCRIDAFVRVFESGKVETIIIEINSLPGMTPATCIFHQCALNNYKPYEFIDEILNVAI